MADGTFVDGLLNHLRMYVQFNAEQAEDFVMNSRDTSTIGAEVQSAVQTLILHIGTHKTTTFDSVRKRSVTGAPGLVEAQQV
jgi:hypothetical protein